MNKREEFEKALKQLVNAGQWEALEGERDARSFDRYDKACARTKTVFAKCMALFDAAQPSQDALPELPEPYCNGVIPFRFNDAPGMVWGVDRIGLALGLDSFTADQMLAYGDQCRAAGQWIACSERLPEQDAEVLAYSPDHECHAAWFDQDVFKVSKPTNYASGQYEDWDSDKPVTHWMPLPPVPEAK